MMNVVIARVLLRLAGGLAAAAAMLGPRVATAEEHAAAVPPTPQQVQAATVLAAGYSMRLAAAEPAVVDPVAITFDEDARPYVVEYRDYPEGPPPGSPAMSRIVRLDDVDGDGFYEGSTVVADHVPFAQGVLAARGGLLVTAAPDVLMLVDADGDGRADRRDVIASGFKVGNSQLRAACPQLDIDNTVSITGGLSGGVVNRPGRPASEGVKIDRRDVKIDLATGRIAAATGFGQFGNAFDDLGRRFTTSNRNPVIAVRLPADAIARNTFVDLGGGYEDVAPSGAASRVFPIAETNATAASHAGTHTSACGLTIFRGDLLGTDAVGDAFICEPVSHLVTRRRMRPLGASFASDHVGADGTEFLASRDPWFRPVFTATGPDGALWVIDMCRRTIEHPQYMPAGLAETLDLRAGDQAGRIWRIQRDGLTARRWVAPATAAEAAALLCDPNGWRRSTAQRLLVEGRFADAESAIRAMLATKPSAVATVHALWTLHGLGKITAADVRAAANAPEAGVREAAARLAPLIDPTDLAAEIAGRCGGDDDAHVRLAAILAASGSPAASATETLAAAAARRPYDAWHDQWIDRAVLSGAVGRAAALLEAMSVSAVDVECTEPLVEFVERLGGTAAGAVASGETAASPAGDAAAALGVLVDRNAAGRGSWFDVALLSGLASRMPLARLSSAPTGSSIPAVIDLATAFVRDGRAPEAARKTAIRLLGAATRSGGDSHASAARDSLRRLVESGASAELQSAAVGALVRSGDATAVGGMVDAVGSGTLEPTVRTAAVTALADRRDGAGLLLAAIESKKVPASVVPLDRRAALARSPDAAIREAAGRIWNAGGAAGLTEQEVAGFVSAARAGGIVDRGRELFVKHCSACHQAPASGGSVAVPGQQVGPALAEAADRPIEQIVVAIVDPNRAVEPRWESSVVVTEDGEVIEGIVAESGQDLIVIVRAGGERRTVPRQQIETLQASGRSLMPEGFGRSLQPVELADVVAFLRGGRPVPRAAAPPAAAATGATAPTSVQAPVPAPRRFRAGAHVEDISPTHFPVTINGGLKQTLATSIVDPMNARCLALDDGDRQLVIAVIDACMVPLEIVVEAKSLVSRETGIPPERMLVSATHTHSAAALTPVFQCDPSPDYVATVAGRIARGMIRAVANLEPAECGWASSSTPEHVFHRRWFMKPGQTYENPFGVRSDRVRMNPDVGSGTVSVPAGPVDQDVAVLAVRSAGDKRPIGLLANYSLHYVGGVQPISADYFGAFAAEMARRLRVDDASPAGRPPLVAILSNGTSGNVNSNNFARSPKHKAAAGSRIRLVANAVADAAVEAHQAIEWRSDVTLDSEHEELKLAVRKGSPAELAQAKAWLESIPQDTDGQWSDRKAIYARETLKLAEYPDEVPVPLQVLRVGDLSVAAIPCEVFVETGLRLKQTSPFARHFTVSLANGYNGYLPRASDHALGGYETWRARSSYLEVDAEAKIVAAIERMSATLAARRGQEATPPR